MAIEWIDPNGSSTTLRVEFDVRGQFFPSVILDEDSVPGKAGGLLNSVRHGPLDFAWPIWVQAATDVALRTALRALVFAMDPTRGVGTIRATAPGGDQREIRCVVADGLSAVEKLGETSTTIDQRLVLAFRSYDPYWTSVSDTVTDFTVGSVTTSFFPFFPLRLSSSEIAIDTSVTNSGDVEAWPVWTITGPGSGIVLSNLTAGLTLTLSGLTLGAGESLSIDTRPGAKTITRNDGANMWSYVSSTSAMWPLQRGSNAIRLEMTGTTSSSALRLSYRPRYLSP